MATGKKMSIMETNIALMNMLGIDNYAGVTSITLTLTPSDLPTLQIERIVDLRTGLRMEADFEVALNHLEDREVKQDSCTDGQSHQ